MWFQLRLNIEINRYVCSALFYIVNTLLIFWRLSAGMWLLYQWNFLRHNLVFSWVEQETNWYIYLSVCILKRNKTMDTSSIEIIFNTTFRLTCSHHQLVETLIVLKIISINGVSTISEHLLSVPLFYINEIHI